eukprot:13932-Heterococcus_DN1.PRE.8
MLLTASNTMKQNGVWCITALLRVHGRDSWDKQVVAAGAHCQCDNSAHAAPICRCPATAAALQ